MTKNPYIVYANKNLQIVVKGKPYVIDKTNDLFQKVLDYIQSPDPISDDDLILLLDNVLAIQKACSVHPNITYEGDHIFFKGMKIHSYLTEKIKVMMFAKFDVAPMIRLLSNMMCNPSQAVLTSLVEFMEHGNLPITSDGHFLAYKFVNKDYTDNYTGTISNKCGETVTMPRDMVNDNPYDKCAKGLHVCTIDYITANITRPNEVHIMVCKVNPRDVVAVPHELATAKMRVCRYKVVDELDGMVIHELFYGDKSKRKEGNDENHIANIWSLPVVSKYDYNPDQC